MSDLQQYNQYPADVHVELTPNQSRFTGSYDARDMKGVKTAPNPLHYREFPSNTYKLVLLLYSVIACPLCCFFIYNCYT